MKNFLFDVFFPRRCCGCDKITVNKSPICRECENKVLCPSNLQGRCEVCFLPKKDCICPKHTFYEKLAVPFINEGTVRKNISKMKFRGRLDLIKPFAEMAVRSLNERKLLDGIDIITFVPMSRLEKFRRGYNQSQLFALELSKITGKPYLPLLKKVFATAPQHTLDSRSRSGNLLGVYEPIKKNLPAAVGRTVLIADDIITTGATVNEAAKTLLIFGAERIEVCACAATKKKKH